MQTNKKSFKIPYGLSLDNKIFTPYEAIKGSEYFCPGCKEPLIFKCGEIVKPHFSHKRDTQCTPESIEHILGKMFIEKAIQENIKGNRRIVLEFRRICCGEPVLLELKPYHFMSCVQEKLVEPYVCDIFATTKNGSTLAIEVFQTHKVDEIKADTLRTPWIELKTKDIFKNSFIWNPCDSRLNFIHLCEDCHFRFKRIIESKIKEKILNIPCEVSDVSKLFTDYISCIDIDWKDYLCLYDEWYGGIEEKNRKIFAIDSQLKKEVWNEQNFSFIKSVEHLKLVKNTQEEINALFS